METPMKMDKLEYRAVIKFLHLQGKKPLQIHKEMCEIYADDAPLYEVVKHWCGRFKSGQLSIRDEARNE